MLSKQKLLQKVQNASIYVFVFQTGILVGIEAVYLAVFTQNPHFQEVYGNPSLTIIGVATSLYPIFAAVGAVLVLYLVHLLGNVTILAASAFLWLAGYLIGTFVVGHIGALMGARIIKGLAVGLLTSILPLYIEKVVSSKRQAARILTLLQASVPLGILMMALVAKLATSIEFHFRWICTAVPALPIVLVVFYLPHADGMINQAKEAQCTAQSDKSAWAKTVADLSEIKKSRSNYMRLIAASLAQSAAPLTAINVIFYYSTVLCQMLGFDANDSEYMAIGLYATNFAGTTLSLFFINRLQRLATIRFTILALGVLHLVLFIVRECQSNYENVSFLGMILIAFVFVFVFLFSTFFSGISLVYTSEVVPQRTRTASIGLATSFGWLCNFVVTMASAALLPVLGSYIFYVFGGICFIMYCAFAIMPETFREVSGTAVV